MADGKKVIVDLDEVLGHFSHGADAENVRYLVERLRDSTSDAAKKIADQIEAQTKPSRIPEPGLWGVVEASTQGSTERYHYVRRDPDGYWYTLRGAQRSWSELIDPVLVREGVDG